ncbi:MAG TPA: hypothetical protein VK668_15040 [Mucilaginibacter sp.]|nr:hypothetical protein [Mucilaginibacter sp.]
MKQFSCILFALLVFASCKKENIAKIDYGCIHRSLALPHLSVADSITVAVLLQSNTISSDSLVFYGYTSNWHTNTDLTHDYFQFATATQVKNGLPVFYGDLTYTFKFGFIWGLPFKYNDPIKLNTKPTFQFEKLKQAFLDEGINNQAMAASYKDSCLTAQFGYYNLNKLLPYTSPICIKAWQIHADGSNFPVAYFRDDTGELIYFQLKER